MPVGRAFLPENTVKRHMKNIYAKQEAILWAEQ
jgi:DNA-binding CsgD family transcriptional regulator